jgi:asparagine synthase (glutamine-hydrolysing)
MCGVLGLSWDSPSAKECFEEALRRQTHRGPDQTSYKEILDPRLFIGTNRLAIQDLESGTQPMASDDNLVAISFNGEIFNAKDLRSELELTGVKFNSDHSDTEVILQGYLSGGIDFVSKLNGMFAILISDSRSGELIGIRDRIGIKPLHYFADEDFFTCSSELDPLMFCLKNANKKIDLNWAAIREYFHTGFISGPKTIFSKVFSLEPGHMFIVELKNANKMTIKKWWKLEKNAWHKANKEDLPELIRNDLLRAVRDWSTSDFKIALSLSGGVDSTCILMANKVLGLQIETFSLVFEESKYSEWDESTNISKTVESLGYPHTSIQITAKEFENSLPSLVRSLGQPYGGGLPSYRIFEEISKTHRVCMTGTGGDELFGNYERHKIVDESTFHSQKNLDAKYTSQIYKSRKDLLNLIFPKLFNKTNINDWIRYVDQENLNNTKKQIESIDLKTQLPDEFLLVTDRLSMKYSLEARTPFLDHVFLQNIMSIDTEIRSNGPYKHLLRSAFAAEFKRIKLSESKKGFKLPLSQWIRSQMNGWAEDKLSDPKMRLLLQPDEAFLQRLFLDFKAGNNDNILLLWRLIMFSIWITECEYL